MSNLDIFEKQKSLVLPGDRSPDHPACDPGTIMNKLLLLLGAWGSIVVKALRY
jgi:hypothetical protein